jgi:hypothetical protein
VTTVWKLPWGVDRREWGHEIHGGEVAALDVAEVHEAEIAFLVDDGVEGVQLTDQTYDLELLLVQRIAGQVALRPPADPP